jgi:DNA-binding phage protein
MSNATHWTEQSPEDFLYSIASDFVEQLQSKMKALDNMTRAKLAKAAGISKGRISQIFNDPGNISLDTVVRLARALGLKVSVVAYEDPDDPHNERGPVNADVLRRCWEDKGRPFDMWSFKESAQVVPSVAGCIYQEVKGRHDGRRAGQSPALQSLVGEPPIDDFRNLDWDVSLLTKRVPLSQLMPKGQIPSWEAATDACSDIPIAT